MVRLDIVIFDRNQRLNVHWMVFPLLFITKCQARAEEAESGRPSGAARGRNWQLNPLVRFVGLVFNNPLAST